MENVLLIKSLTTNIMKHFLFCLALCTTFAACSWFHAESVPALHKYTNQQLLDSLEMYKSYFYPHEKGDSIVFLREDSTIDVYFVDNGTKSWITYYNDTDTTIMSTGIQMYLQQDEQYIHVFMLIERSGKTTRDVFIRNKMKNWEGKMSDFQTKEDDIVVTNAFNDSWGVLRRNVGIVYVQDDKRHTWTTILPQDSI